MIICADGLSVIRIGSMPYNQQLPKTYPKARISAIAHHDHFSELKEAEVLQVAYSGGLIAKDVQKILKEKLRPTKYGSTSRIGTRIPIRPKNLL